MVNLISRTMTDTMRTMTDTMRTMTDTMKKKSLIFISFYSDYNLLQCESFRRGFHLSQNENQTKSLSGA